MKTIKFRAKTKKGAWIYNLAPLVPFSVFGNRYDNPEVFDQYAQESRV